MIPVLRKFTTSTKKFSLRSFASDHHQFGSSTISVDRPVAGYCVYKGKAALSVKPIPAKFATSPQGFRSVDREGSLFLEIAPVGSTPREYDWSQKITFALNATECGDLLVAQDFSKFLEFIHDPGAGGAVAGKKTKKLRVSAMQDGKGVFLQVTSTTKEEGTQSVTVPLTWGEMEVIKTNARFFLPRMLGWDKV
eukprot:gene6532-7207_t